MRSKARLGDLMVGSSIAAYRSEFSCSHLAVSIAVTERKCFLHFFEQVLVDYWWSRSPTVRPQIRPINHCHELAQRALSDQLRDLIPTWARRPRWNAWRCRYSCHTDNQSKWLQFWPPRNRVPACLVAARGSRQPQQQPRTIEREPSASLFKVLRYRLRQKGLPDICHCSSRQPHPGQFSGR